MKRIRTIISFTQFQDIEPHVIKTLTNRNQYYGVWHSNGVTTVMVEGKINKTDFDILTQDYIKMLYHEETSISEMPYERQDDPNDIVDCMQHCISGLIDT